MTNNTSKRDDAPGKSSFLGLPKFAWALIIVAALGYTFGKDLAFKHNQADAAKIEATE